MHFDDLFSGEGNPFEMLESFQERFHHKDFGWDSTFQFHFPPEMFDQESMRFDSLGEHALEQLRHLQPDQFPQPGKLFGPNQWNFFPDEKAIGEALIEDGYLSEGERIQSMEWNEQEFKVNGKVIEKADAKKYRELMNQHSSRTGD